VSALSDLVIYVKEQPKNKLSSLCAQLKPLYKVLGEQLVHKDAMVVDKVFSIPSNYVPTAWVVVFTSTLVTPTSILHLARLP